MNYLVEKKIGKRSRPGQMLKMCWNMKNKNFISPKMQIKKHFS